MYYRMNQKSCYNYTPANDEINSSYKRDMSCCDCNNCVFFSSKNCGADFADKVEIEEELF